MDFNDPLPSLQESLIGLSFQFGSGGQANPGSARTGAGGDALELQQLQGGLGNLNNQFDDLSRQLKSQYGF